MTITDRIKDVIIRGGETISSGQVEEVLNAHPAVADGVAVAAPDPRYGDVVAAVVVLKPGCELDLDGLRAHFVASRIGQAEDPGTSRHRRRVTAHVVGQGTQSATAYRPLRCHSAG